jgi:hypothetical protein
VVVAVVVAAEKRSKQKRSKRPRMLLSLRML